MKYHKLPTRKNIGRGYTISIKLITPTELSKMLNEAKAYKKHTEGDSYHPESIGALRAPAYNSSICIYSSSYAKHTSARGLRPLVRRSSAGAWIDTERTIYIDKSLSKQRQWEVYWHELMHAILDISTLDRGGI